MTQRMPVLFLGHGSPMTVISDVPERRAFETLGPALPRPRAILAVSAHWQSHGKTLINAQEEPRTIHDFGGFPDELFAIQYPARTDPGLIARIVDLAGAERIGLDHEWGYDHGTWGVVRPMFPAADIPLVSMSLDRSLPPDAHLALAASLAPLRDEGVLILGSGNIIHNLRTWRQTQGTRPEWALEFQQRINAAIMADDREALTRFAPDDQAAGLAINSAEHYLPLLYAIGARLPGDEVGLFNDTVDGSMSMTSVLLGDRRLLTGIA